MDSEGFKQTKTALNRKNNEARKKKRQERNDKREAWVISGEATSFHEVPTTLSLSEEYSDRWNIAALDMMLMTKEVQDLSVRGYSLFAVKMPHHCDPSVGENDRVVSLPIIGNAYGDVLVLKFRE